MVTNFDTRIVHRARALFDCWICGVCIFKSKAKFSMPSCPEHLQPCDYKLLVIQCRLGLQRREFARLSQKMAAKMAEGLADDLVNSTVLLTQIL